jgi:hypothetical protein
MDKKSDKQKRSEIKRAYKEAKGNMGVFEIKNNINGKLFVDSCFEVIKNKQREYFGLRLGSHMNRELQNEWKEYGEENFSYEVLEVVEFDKGTDVDLKYDLKKLEEKWLEKLQPYDEKGYNKRKTR